MRVPSEAQWARWRRKRAENDEREKREGTYCRVTAGPGPDYEAEYRNAYEADQFERSDVLLTEELRDRAFVVMERPDGHGVFGARVRTGRKR